MTVQIDKVKAEAQRLRDATRDQIMTYLTAGLSVVAGLAWNEAISSLIKQLFPDDASSLSAKFLYAFFVTIFIVFLTLLIRRFLGKKTEETK